MTIEYSRLFEPLNIGKVRIKNRIALAPMGIVGLADSGGAPSQRAVDYYLERARGGTGLIITSLFRVDCELELGAFQMIDRSWVKPFGELCEAIHAFGCKIFVQLTAGFGRVRPYFPGGPQPVSASAVPHYGNPSITCRALETGEVDRLVAAFGPAARFVVATGADGIELHGHEGYIFDQFTTAIWNQRTDKYGGDLMGRLTFPIEVLRTIKGSVGDDFPVQYRFGLKHNIKGLNSGGLPGEEYKEAGRDVEEGLEMAKILEAEGFDSLHVDAGCYDSWYWAHPPTYQEHGHMVDMAAMAKDVVNIPVVAVGKLDVPELAENVIKEGKADIIAIGRGLLADPYWPLKTARGEVDDIRPCIGCHDGCLGRFGTGRPLSCAVNPSCGRENLYRLSPTLKKRKILVAGGGPAGMEAARIAESRGHKVILYEKNDKLGGHLIEASVPGFKKDLGSLLAWYNHQLHKSGVKIVMKTEVSEEKITQEKPDVVIIATGSKPLIPDVPGIENDKVVTCVDVLLGKREAGHKVVVIGGGLVGCETALWLAQEGKKVTLVEMLPELLSGGILVPDMNKTMLLDLIIFHKVNTLTGHKMLEVNEEGVVVEDKGNERKVIEADTVVLSSGLISHNELYDSLIGKFPEVYNVGDCQEPRNIMGAIWEGYEIGRTV